MTSRSGRGRWQHVLEARRQSREALGRDPGQGNLFDGPPKKKSAAYVPLTAVKVEPRPSEAVGVLLFNEAVIRLGLSRAELEGLIADGKVEALPMGYAVAIPTREVERLESRRRPA